MSDERNPPSSQPVERKLRLVVTDEHTRDAAVEEPFYTHVQASDELRRALEHVQRLLRRASFISSAERGRVNALVAVDDLLSALRGELHGRPAHQSAIRIDRVSAAIWNCEVDKVATFSLVKAIIEESRRFHPSGAMPDYSMACPSSLEEFMAMWPERWMDLKADKFIAAAQAWSKGGPESNAPLWMHVAEAAHSARLSKRLPASYGRYFRQWEAAGLLTR